MKAKFNLVGYERRNMVYAIAGIINEDVKYLGMPSGAYRVGNYIVDMSGILRFDEDAAEDEEEFTSLLKELSGKGYVAEYSSLSDDAESTEDYSDDGDNTDESELSEEMEEAENMVDNDFAETGSAEDDNDSYEVSNISEISEVEVNDGDEDSVMDETDQDVIETQEAAVSLENEEEPDVFNESDGSETLAEIEATEDAGNTDISEDIYNSTDNSGDRLTIAVSRKGFSDFSIDNLRKLVQSKQTLIKMSLEADDLPIEVSEDKISFPWFNALDGDHVTAYSQLIEKLCKRAKEATRIYGIETPFTDPRTAFRIFLTRLGFSGTKYLITRRILMEKLQSSSLYTNESGTSSSSLDNTVQSQIRTLQNAGEVNMYDDAAVQNAAHNSGMSELVYYIENFRKNPRTEYIRFLLCENDDSEKDHI